jgi:chorismate mutase
MTKRLFGIRGAVCCANTPDSIVAGVEHLGTALFHDNNLAAHDIVSIQFTVTEDLTALNPATALRWSSVGLVASQCALFCSQEPRYEGSLPGVVRVLITAYMDEGAHPVSAYLDGAEKLRPDLAKK